MAMPHLMNCPHSDSGWCLECVKEMHDRYEQEVDPIIEDVSRLRAEIDTWKREQSREDDEMCQILGKVLGCPWFKDDQKNFPGATEADGVCIGDDVPVTMAMKAAREIGRLRAELEGKNTDDPTPITEKWAATVRGNGVELVQSVDPRVPPTWFLEYHNDCGWVTARCWVTTRGQVVQILNAVRPQKEGM